MDFNIIFIINSKNENTLYINKILIDTNIQLT